MSSVKKVKENKKEVGLAKNINQNVAFLVRIIRIIPGFRSGQQWKQFTALFVYAYTLFFLYVAFAQSMVWGSVTSLVFIISLVFLFDIGEIWALLRLPKDDVALKVFFVLVYLCIAITILYVFSPFGLLFPDPVSQQLPQPIDFPAP